MPKRNWLPVLILVLLGAAPTALGADDDAARIERIRRTVRLRDGFFTVKYGHYVVKTDVDAQFAAEAALYMRRFYEAFRSFFKPRPKLKATPVVYLFKDQASYQAHVKKLDKKANLLKAGGFYSGGRTRSELFCWHNRPGIGFAGFPTRVIRHEGAHQLLSYILGTHDIPIWYNEGVATFFEGWDVEKPRAWNLENLGRTQTRFHLIRKTFDTPEFLDLHYLVQLTSKTWVPDHFGPKTSLHYAEVQSFMTFLLVSERGRKFFSILFRAIAGGRNPSRMLSRKAIDGAQKAWYKDIADRIERSKTATGPAALKPEK